jgi:hypothetical protein
MYRAANQSIARKSLCSKDLRRCVDPLRDETGTSKSCISKRPLGGRRQCQTAAAPVRARKKVRTFSHGPLLDPVSVFLTTLGDQSMWSLARSERLLC